jgi:hypothetical protein
MVERVRSAGQYLPYEQVLGELLAFDAAPVARRQLEPGVQEPRYHLDRVELAVAVQREADDVVDVLLVPGDAGAGVHHRLVGLGEDLVEQGAVAGEHDALPQVRADVQRHALVHVLAQLARVLGGGAVGAAEAGALQRVAARSQRAVLYPVLLQLLQLADHGCKARMNIVLRE